MPRLEPRIPSIAQTRAISSGNRARCSGSTMGGWSSVMTVKEPRVRLLLPSQVSDWRLTIVRRRSIRALLRSAIRRDPFELCRYTRGGHLGRKARQIHCKAHNHSARLASLSEKQRLTVLVTIAHPCTVMARLERSPRANELLLQR